MACAVPLPQAVGPWEVPLPSHTASSSSQVFQAAPSTSTEPDKALGSEPPADPVGAGVAAAGQTHPKDSSGQSRRGSILGTAWPTASTSGKPCPKGRAAL